MNMKKRLIWLFLSLGFILPSPASALVTPFGIRVNDAINRGLELFRSQQDLDGGWGEATGLVLLCFLERREGPDWNAPALGYINMDDADKDRVRRGIKYCIDDIDGFRGDTPNSYRAGACMVAMSLYIVTGGQIMLGPPSRSTRRSLLVPLA